jgi:hypothetical protein
MRASSSVAIASISGTTRSGRSFSTTARSALDGHVHDVEPWPPKSRRVGVAIDGDHFHSSL